jgi:hypothetical protein
VAGVLPTQDVEGLKAEFEPGNGDEHDVPGLYAHVMLQAYELSHEKALSGGGGKKLHRD